MERAIKASSVEWPREIPPTEAKGRREEGGCTQNGGECERADSDDDSIEKRAMEERAARRGMDGRRGRSVGLVLEDWDPDRW